MLRYPYFRLIWSAEVVSQIGTHIQRVAVAWQVFEMTGDPLQLGLLGLARFHWMPGTAGKGEVSPQQPCSVSKSIDERGSGSI